MGICLPIYTLNVMEPCFLGNSGTSACPCSLFCFASVCAFCFPYWTVCTSQLTSVLILPVLSHSTNGDVSKWIWGASLLAGVKPEPESKSVSSRPSSRHPNCRFPSFLSALLILQINYVCSISRKFFTLLPLHFKIYMQRCQVLHARSKNVKLKCSYYRTCCQYSQLFFETTHQHRLVKRWNLSVDGIKRANHFAFVIWFFTS